MLFKELSSKGNNAWKNWDAEIRFFSCGSKGVQKLEKQKLALKQGPT